MELSAKIKKYNKSFLGFLKESKSDFILIEAKMERDIATYIAADPELFRRARRTFKTYKDEESFDSEWIDIVDYVFKHKKLQPTTSQIYMAHNSVPMMVYNILKNSGEL